jgi:hypothetical protein
MAHKQLLLVVGELVLQQCLEQMEQTLSSQL